MPREHAEEQGASRRRGADAQRPRPAVAVTRLDEGVTPAGFHESHATQERGVDEVSVARRIVELHEVRRLRPRPVESQGRDRRAPRREADHSLVEHRPAKQEATFDHRRAAARGHRPSGQGGPQALRADRRRRVADGPEVLAVEQRRGSRGDLPEGGGVIDPADEGGRRHRAVPVTAEQRRRDREQREASRRHRARREFGGVHARSWGEGSRHVGTTMAGAPDRLSAAFSVREARAGRPSAHPADEGRSPDGARAAAT